MSKESIQQTADRLTAEIMQYFYGKRFRECENIEDDSEMNLAWEYINTQAMRIIQFK